MKKQTTLMARVWADLSPINVNEHVQKKGNLSYLSWTWAWATLMERYPESYYVFQDNRFEDGSVMVECVLTIHEGEEVATRTMWLPVMDHRNKAIINPNARDISDTRMRCLVKCLAMFGLGFYIFSGSDIPEAEKGAVITEDQVKELHDLFRATGADPVAWANHYKVKDISELPAEKFEQVRKPLREHMETAERSAAQAEAVDEL